jgi:hypothetical protein
MLLRPYREEDFDDLGTAWRAASLVAHSFLSPDLLDAEVESIRDIYLPASETWGAVDEEGAGESAHKETGNALRQLQFNAAKGLIGSD